MNEHGLAIAWATVIKIADGFFALLPNLLIAAIVFGAFYFWGKLNKHAVLVMANRANVDQTLAQALSRLAALFTNILGLLVCAVIIVPTFSPGQLIAGLGITSVAIGFALQNILQNFFAGLLLLWQKPFGIGDEIKSRDYEGTVEDITIRTTLLRTYSGERVYIPNSVLLTDPFTVNTAHAKRRVHLTLPVNDTPGEKARAIAQSALAHLPSVSKSPKPEIYISPTGGTWNLDIYFWAASKNAELRKATAEATAAIQSALADSIK